MYYFNLCVHLQEVLVRTDDGMCLMPESYAVPADSVTAEYSNPGSQPREVVGRCPFLWGQSLYILGKLLQEVKNAHELSSLHEMKSIHFQFNSLIFRRVFWLWVSLIH